MPATTLHDYFRDAPFYREHQSKIGASYRIKDLKDTYAPGLWVADKAQTLEIATRNDLTMSGPPVCSYPTLASARRLYDFKSVAVQCGDAVVDCYLSVREDSGQNVRDWLAEQDYETTHGISHYKKDFDAGTLIRHHIPRDEFNAAYEFDGTHYLRKKFQIKFAPEDAFIELPNGEVEQIKRYSEIFLINGEMTTRPIEIYSGIYERMICGQPLAVYWEAACEITNLKNNPDGYWLALPPLATGLSLHIIQRSGGKPIIRNPYAGMKAEYHFAQKLLTDPGVRLSSEQRADFDAHFYDIQRRYDYFERHPPKL